MSPERIAEFPEIVQFLFTPARFKVAYGGRDGAKSWSFARALLLFGAQRKILVLCCRETMKSIADSVHRVLSNQIIALGLQEHYTVERARIIGRNGTEFVFAGLRHNIDNIKSLEACDIVWAEEAANISKDSWSKLIPTIRKDDSEIWVSFNPELEQDDTYQRFVVKPPPDAVVVEITYRDNPWPSKVLEAERDALYITDRDAWEHIWNGKPKRELEGAIYAKELRAAEDEDRIRKVPYDPSRPVHTAWDLGEGDATVIWFFQVFMAEYRFIDFYSNTGQKMAHYLGVMQGKGYVYGIDYLPWDACSGMLSGTLESAMRAAGRQIRILPKHLSVEIGIDQARTIFPLCWFDAEKCADGLNGLRYYQYGPVKDMGTQTRRPLHNWASHPADGFRSAANGIQLPKRAIEPPKTPTTPRRSAPPATAWS
jgi:phage terminase large subunit